MNYKIILLGIIGIFVSCQRNGQTKNNTWPSCDDTVYIEKITNRKIIDIDSTSLSTEERERLYFHLKSERDYVDSTMRLTFDYNMPKGYCVVHFFYNRELNCGKICPDMFVYLSDSTLLNIKQHLYKSPQGEINDSIITENIRKIESEDKLDTFYRTRWAEGNKYTALLEGKCWGSCSGFTTIVHVYLEERYITIHEHHKYFCQTHDPISYYEYLWKWQKEKQSREKSVNNKSQALRRF